MVKCGGDGPRHISWGISIPIPNPSPSRLTISIMSSTGIPLLLKGLFLIREALEVATYPTPPLVAMFV